MCSNLFLKGKRLILKMIKFFILGLFLFLGFFKVLIIFGLWDLKFESYFVYIVLEGVFVFYFKNFFFRLIDVLLY